MLLSPPALFCTRLPRKTYASTTYSSWKYLRIGLFRVACSSKRVSEIFMSASLSQSTTHSIYSHRRSFQTVVLPYFFFGSLENALRRGVRPLLFLAKKCAIKSAVWVRRPPALSPRPTADPSSYLSYADQHQCQYIYPLIPTWGVMYDLEMS